MEQLYPEDFGNNPAMLLCLCSEEVHTEQSTVYAVFDTIKQYKNTED